SLSFNCLAGEDTKPEFCCSAIETSGLLGHRGHVRQAISKAIRLYGARIALLNGDEDVANGCRVACTLINPNDVVPEIRKDRFGKLANRQCSCGIRKLGDVRRKLRGAEIAALYGGKAVCRFH